MYRKMSRKIKEWIDNETKALLVTGARQIGKTWLIRDEITKSKYNLFEINFIDQPDMVDYFNTNMSADDFLVKLKLLLPSKYKEGKTIVFFDEIQSCPEIVTKIKFLVDEGSFKYVLSGSLLGVELQGIASMPVGYLSILKLHPMDIEEFMIACDVSNKTFDILKERFVSYKPIDDFIHNKLLELFYIYLIVGGMPEAVKKYIETKDIRKVNQIQQEIVSLYREDFAKYEKEEKKLRIKNIYDVIPAQLNMQNKKFTFTLVDKELKFDRYENSFLWLKDAGVALPVYNASEPIIPLLLSKQSNVFKLFLNDIGLLTSSYPYETKIELINKNENVNNGAHFENFIAEQLNANGLKLYYYKKSKVGEVDFITEIDGKVIPIEVKSGKGYKKHKALDNLLSIPNYKINKAYVFSTSNIEVDDKICYLPIYMCYLLKEQEVESMKVEVDLRGL